MEIYKITNLLNNKIYIGKTLGNAINRWKHHIRRSKCGSTTDLHKDIMFCGKEQFKLEVLAKNIVDAESLTDLEEFYIQLYHSSDPSVGYNMVSAILNRGVTEEVRNKISHKIQKVKGIRNISKYIGVWETPPSWICSIRFSNVYYRKNFCSESEAAEAYDKMALYFHGVECDLNFPEKRSAYLLENLNSFYQYFTSKNHTSKYYGVSWQESIKKWRVSIRYKGCTQYFGSYSSEIESAEIADKVRIFLKLDLRRLNFPEYLDRYQTEDLEKFYSETRHNRIGKYYGVRLDRDGKYNAYMFDGIKPIYLKRFKTAEEAARYREKIIIQTGNTHATKNF